MLDLVLRGGRIATSSGLGVADVGIAHGAVVQLGGEMSGQRELDAGGRYVLPGGIDMHVHLTSARDPGPGVERWVDDFLSGSLAAIHGGVTTIGNMTFQRPGETPRQALERELKLAAGRAAVDYVLHPVLTDPSAESLAEIAGLASDGHTSLKLFMVSSNFDARVGDYLRALETAGEAGVLTMVHCEDAAIIGCACSRLMAQGRHQARHWPESRPDYAESVATERAVAYAQATGAPIYVVHLSSGLALDACRRGRARGVRVYVETRPMYLHLTDELFEEPDAAKYVGAPPLRAPADRAALWTALATGDIHCVCTDHAPWTLEQKLDPSLDVRSLRQGVSDLETMMPMLWSEGVVQGRITIERFVELTSTNAARLFGMYPRKGTVAVGSDADLVVWNGGARRTIQGASMLSRSGYSVYEGRAVQGWPEVVISRGDVVYEGGQVQAEAGRGRLVKRSPTQPL